MDVEGYRPFLENQNIIERYVSQCTGYYFPGSPIYYRHCFGGSFDRHKDRAFNMPASPYPRTVRQLSGYNGYMYRAGWSFWSIDGAVLPVNLQTILTMAYSAPRLRSPYSQVDFYIQRGISYEAEIEII